MFFHVYIPMSLSFINPLFHVFPGKLWILIWLFPAAQGCLLSQEAHEFSCAHLPKTVPAGLAGCRCSLMEGVVSEGHGTLPEISSYSCSPVTSNFMSPQGGEEYKDGKGFGEGTPCRTLLGSHRSCWAQPFQGGSFTAVLAPTDNPWPIILVSNSSRLVGSLNGLWWALTRICYWDLRRRG